MMVIIEIVISNTYRSDAIQKFEDRSILLSFSNLAGPLLLKINGYLRFNVPEVRVEESGGGTEETCSDTCPGPNCKYQSIDKHVCEHPCVYGSCDAIGKLECKKTCCLCGNNETSTCEHNAGINDCECADACTSLSPTCPEKLKHLNLCEAYLKDASTITITSTCCHKKYGSIFRRYCQKTCGVCPKNTTLACPPNNTTK